MAHPDNELPAEYWEDYEDLAAAKAEREIEDYEDNKLNIGG